MSSDTPSLPRIPSPCRAPGCHTLTTEGRCPTHRTEQARTHRARRAYYHTTEWTQLRATVLDRDYHQCVVCTSTHRLTAHHVRPRKNGGADRIDNLVTVCQSCHGRIERAEPRTTTRMAEHLDAIGLTPLAAWVRSSQADHRP